MSSGYPWRPVDEKWIRILYPDRPTADVARLMGRSIESVHSRASALGLRKDVGQGGHRPWTEIQEQLLRSLYPHHSTAEVAKRVGHSKAATYGWAKKLSLHKSAEYMASPAACRLRRGDKVGATFRFLPGHVPANKGTRRPGWGPGRMAATQFKKGQLPLNTMPLWCFRFNTDGYLLLKTGAPAPKPNDGWEFVHRMVWEQAHGPVPAGHRIWWKDRDRGNCSLSNLELLSDAEHMRRTTIHNLPPELVKVIQLNGALKRKIRNREKKQSEKHDGGPAQPSVRCA